MPSQSEVETVVETADVTELVEVTRTIMVGTGRDEKTVMVLSADEVANIAFRYEGTGQINALCRSHEALRKAYVVALERIAAQSELLTRKATVSEKRIRIPKERVPGQEGV